MHIVISRSQIQCLRFLTIFILTFSYVFLNFIFMILRCVDSCLILHDRPLLDLILDFVLDFILIIISSPLFTFFYLIVLPINKYGVHSILFFLPLSFQFLE
ncbi:hypothetical protein RND81_13G187500 [Saponaria officinalis]|uniref:Uncharacterized protein n=1 Tax=Saponaria officinalis TaxID=3572 RepID=A0AAW1H4M7_SAPOF